MEIKLSLERNRSVRISGVAIADEEVVLSFESGAFNLDNLVVNVSNGKESIRREVKGRVLDISPLCKVGCVIEINAEITLKDKTVKKWDIEPLVIRECEGKSQIYPEIVLLREEVATMKKIIKELNTKINDTM